MKLIFIQLLLSLSIPVIAQQDTLNIEFITDHDTFPDCFNIYAVNGEYTLPSRAFNGFRIPGFKYVEPRNFFKEEHSPLYSLPELAESMGYFEYPIFYWKELSYREADSLFQNTKNSIEENKNHLGYGYSWTDFLEDNNLVLTYGKDFWEVRFIENDSVVICDSVEQVYRSSNNEFVAGIIGGPYSNVIEGYINGTIDATHYQNIIYNQRIAFEEANSQAWDSIVKVHLSIREEKVTPLLDSILQPFYLSKYEVTNGEYREFIEYVRDSIALDKLYSCLEDDELAANLLNISRKERKKLDLTKREANKEKYGLARRRNNGKPTFYYNDPENVPCLADMYYPQPQRYYKRREIDVRKLNYHLGDSVFVNVYPDTSGFKQLEGVFTEIIENMYAWHPAYYDYPVLNLSFHQMKAYCHWKQHQLNKDIFLDSSYIRVDIPTITQYELAVKEANWYIMDKIHDQTNDAYVSYARDEDLTSYAEYLQKTYATPTYTGPKTSILYSKWLEMNYSPVFPFINGNASEVVRDPVTKKRMEHYGLTSELPVDSLCYSLGGNYYLGVKTRDDVQPNASFYKRLISKEKPDPMSGFRIVLTLETKNN